MDESEWRRLARAALAELPEMGFDPRTQAEVRQELLDALAVVGGRAGTAIRAVLTSRPALREWLRERVGDDPVRSARRSARRRPTAPPAFPPPPATPPASAAPPPPASAAPPELAVP